MNSDYFPEGIKAIRQNLQVSATPNTWASYCSLSHACYSICGEYCILPVLRLTFLHMLIAFTSGCVLPLRTHQSIGSVFSFLVYEYDGIWCMIWYMVDDLTINSWLPQVPSNSEYLGFSKGRTKDVARGFRAVMAIPSKRRVSLTHVLPLCSYFPGLATDLEHFLDVRLMVIHLQLKGTGNEHPFYLSFKKKTYKTYYRLIFKHRGFQMYFFLTLAFS